MIRNHNESNCNFSRPEATEFPTLNSSKLAWSEVTLAPVGRQLSDWAVLVKGRSLMRGKQYRAFRTGPSGTKPRMASSQTPASCQLRPSTFPSGRGAESPICGALQAADLLLLSGQQLARLFCKVMLLQRTTCDFELENSRPGPCGLLAGSWRL